MNIQNRIIACTWTYSQVSIGFPGVQTACTIMQHYWVKQNIPDEATPSDETYEDHMAKLLSSMSK
jgi:hypothetical protein